MKVWEGCAATCQGVGEGGAALCEGVLTDSERLQQVERLAQSQSMRRSLYHLHTRLLYGLGHLLCHFFAVS